MPSFDVVSEVDLQEVHNAVDQANRELSTRYDFRGITASFERLGSDIKLTAQADIQLDQMMDILREKLIKRSVDPMVMDPGAIMPSGKLLHQTVGMKQGIETLLAKKIVKLIKDKKLKVQAAIQGDQVRVTGKKRDDLQGVMAEIKAAGFEIPLQYQNFRDCCRLSLPDGGQLGWNPSWFTANPLWFPWRFSGFRQVCPIFWCFQPLQPGFETKV